MLDFSWQSLPAFADNPTAYIAGAVGVLCVALFLKSQLVAMRADWMMRSLPSPPGALPIFGHALKLLSGTPWDLMEEWIRLYNGQIVRIQVLQSRGIIVGKPPHLNHVLNKRQSNYVKDIELSYKPFLDLLGKGIVTSDGAYWKSQRTLLSHAFRVSILEETADVAKRAVDRLSLKLEKYRGTGEAIDICEEFRLLTLEVIGELILSLPPEVSNQVFPDLYLPIVTEANLRVWYPWRKFMPTETQAHYRKTVNALNDYMCNLIRTRWEERQERIRAGKPERAQPDTLDQVLANVDPATWSEATVLQLRDEFKTFILAGHETSASMMTWCTYQFACSPDVLDKVRAEGRTVFGEARVPGDDAADGLNEFSRSPLPGREKLNELKYTLLCLKETLRFYTPVPIISRVAAADDVIDGHHIPAGTKVFVNVKAVHNDPEVWDEPHIFRPERLAEKFDPYAYLPFINGPRNCLGQHLALLEARIVISLLAQRFTFTPVDIQKCGEVHEYVVPTTPRNGMPVYVN